MQGTRIVLWALVVTFVMGLSGIFSAANAQSTISCCLTPKGKLKNCEVGENPRKECKQKQTAVSMTLAGSEQSPSDDLTGTEAAVTFSQEGLVGRGARLETVGWGFSLDEERTVTHLGIYDFLNQSFDDPNPCREIGVWETLIEPSTLVAQATLCPGAEKADDFFWVELASPVALNADTPYTIGAWYSVSNAPGIATEAMVMPISGVNFEIPSLSGNQQQFEEPTFENSFNDPNGFFGPNLRFAIEE